MPRLRDVWVPKLAVLPNHFVRLYIPGVEDLFQAGDRLLRVEHSGSRSHKPHKLENMAKPKGSVAIPTGIHR